MRTLDVYWNHVLVGCFTELAFGRASFQYVRDYQDGFPISVSMPVQSEPYEAPLVYDFLTNLLPEGEHILRELERTYRLEKDDIFGILASVGQDCAGALILVDPDAPTNPITEGRYELKPVEDIRRWAKLSLDRPAYLANSATGRLRLSLAGMQSKGALYFDADDLPYDPVGDAASSHLLKPRLSGFSPDTAVVEWFTMCLAREVLGPDAVPDCDLWEGIYRVARFDRIRELETGTVYRLHQEDLCQALGFARGVKYETDRRGDNSFAYLIGRLLEDLDRRRLITSLGDERQRFTERILTNVLLGNADGHLKNYGLLYTSGNLIEIAPLYDAVSTIAISLRSKSGKPYARGEPPVPTVLDTNMGLHLGNARDLQSVSREALARFAADIGVAPRFVLRRFDELGERFNESITTVAQRLIDDEPSAARAIETVLPILREHIASLRPAD